MSSVKEKEAEKTNTTQSKILEEAIKLQEEGKIIEAKDKYVEILESEPNNPQALCNIAIIYKQQKNYSKALEYFTKALEVEKSVPIYINLANLYIEIEKYDKAYKLYKKLSKKVPKNPFFKYMQAQMLKKLNKPEQAIELYKEAIKIDKNFIQAYKGIGDIQYEENNFEGAKKLYEMALNINENDVNILYKLHETLLHLKRYDDAETILQKIVPLDRHNPTLYKLFGNLYTIKQNYYDALASFLKVAELNPNDAINYLKIALTYKTLMHIHEASAYYKQAVELDHSLLNIDEELKGTL